MKDSKIYIFKYKEKVENRFLLYVYLFENLCSHRRVFFAQFVYVGPRIHNLNKNTSLKRF